MTSKKCLRVARLFEDESDGIAAVPNGELRDCGSRSPAHNTARARHLHAGLER